MRSAPPTPRGPDRPSGSRSRRRRPRCSGAWTTSSCSRGPRWPCGCGPAASCSTRPAAWPTAAFSGPPITTACWPIWSWSSSDDDALPPPAGPLRTCGKAAVGVVTMGAMARAFRLPDLGEGLTEAEIVKVLVREGDVVREDAPLLEAETDKAQVELPSPMGGRVERIHVHAGLTVRVCGVLVTLADSGGARGDGGTTPSLNTAFARSGAPV